MGTWSGWKRLDMNKITDDLYQGNIADAVAASEGGVIDTIVWLSQGIPRDLSHESVVPIIHIPLKDGKNDPKRIEAVISTLSVLCKDKVLVACRGGISRSPSLVLAYMLWMNDWQKGVEETVRKAIPAFCPSPDLYRQIMRMYGK